MCDHISGPSEHNTGGLSGLGDLYDIGDHLWGRGSSDGYLFSVVDENFSNHFASA